MLEGITSGRLLFLHLAFSCAMLRKSEIVPDDFAELESCLKESKEPSCELLRRCFPNAIPELEAYATQHELHLWMIDTIKKFWEWHIDQVASPRRVD